MHNISIYQLLIGDKEIFNCSKPSQLTIDKYITFDHHTEDSS